MKRIDIALVEQGYCTGRDRAKELIRQGQIFVDGMPVTKASMKISSDANIQVQGALCPYVSRGGLKLEKALQAFQVTVYGKICLDIGSSTGGFTDCLLQHGAKKVYALDVGTQQLVEQLRFHPRVVVMEQTNIREVSPNDFPDSIELIVTDVSFISLTHIFPVASRLLSENGELICLVKPQFEAGPSHVNKQGIVTSKKIHYQVVERVISEAEKEGFFPLMFAYSPITGQKGNIEYLLYLSKNQSVTTWEKQNWSQQIDEAFNTL